MSTLATNITVSGQPVRTAHPRYAAAFRKANSVFCPLGPHPTRAWLLMLKADLDALGTGSTKHTITWAQTGSTTASLTFQGLFLVGSQRIYAGGADDADALHLVEFVDARGLAAKMSDTGETFCNIRSFAEDSANSSTVRYLSGTGTKTWATFCQALWEACPGLGSWPGLPYTPDGEPQNGWFVGQNAWWSLCHVLNKLDCAVKHDPLTNTYTIVELGASQTVPDNASTLKWSAEPAEFKVFHVPEKVRVYFHNHYDGYGQERDTERTTNWMTDGWGEYVEMATGVNGVFAGTVANLWDDLERVIDGTGSLSNSAAVTARATARKTKWLQRQQTTHRHRIHEGLRSDLLPGSQIRATLWRCWGSQNAGLGPLEAGTVTEFISGPDLFSGFDAKGAGLETKFVTDTSLEHYLAPDLGRHTFPNYPRLPNIVQVVHTGDSSRVPVEANDDGYHPGSVRRIVNGSLAVLEDCWIRFVDDHDDLEGAVTAKNYDCYFGRLSGVATSGGLTLPLYTARCGDGEEIVHFELTEDKALAASASAKILALVDGTWTLTTRVITVHDWYTDPGMWTGKSGYRGLAVMRPGTTDEADIIWMERLAHWIDFTSTEDMAAATEEADAQMEVTVDAYCQQGKDPGSTLTVYDPQELYPRALSGAKGHAIYNDQNDRYEIRECQQMSFKAKATLSADMCGSSASITGFAVTMFSPFNQEPAAAPSTAENIYNHRGLSGDAVWLEWDEVLAKWVVIDVEKHDHELTETRYDATTNCFQTRKTDIVIERCEAVGDWEDVICVDDCPSSE